MKMKSESKKKKENRKGKWEKRKKRKKGKYENNVLLMESQHHQEIQPMICIAFCGTR